MSHDIHSAWAATEIASCLKTVPSTCFANPPSSNTFSVFATQENNRRWPVCDGVVRIELNDRRTYDVALEFKRKNEGLHGVLTALGQAHAYIHKGFSASVIILPRSYDSLQDPGNQLNDIIQSTSPELPIGVFTYIEPDPSLASPFQGKLLCERHFQLDSQRVIPSRTASQRVQTQWGHVREGSSDPHAFFKYLQIAKGFVIGSEASPRVGFPSELIEACESLAPGCDPLKYLSNSTSDSFHDKVWREFWFSQVFHTRAVPIWRTRVSGEYEVNAEPTLLMQPNGNLKMFFAGRRDSIKEVLVNKLNEGSITENNAYIVYAENIRNRAHSYREDIDSGLAALGLLEQDGKPTELGYRFVDSCERSGSWDTGISLAILGAALLKNANFGAFLHYIYRLSEKKFSEDYDAFRKGRSGRARFDQDEYLLWLREELADNLCVMRIVSSRGGKPRKPFQAELAVLRNFSFVGGFRLGVGLVINWPAVQEALLFEI